jgi:hypothetical protein
MKPEAFSKLLSVAHVKKNVDKYLHAELQGDLAGLWLAIDQVMSLDECEIYAFHPPSDAEPEAEEGGNLWSLYYFFFSKPDKKVVFFTCRCVSFLAPLQGEERALVDLMPDMDERLGEEDYEEGNGDGDGGGDLGDLDAPLTPSGRSGGSGSGRGRRRATSLSVEEYTMDLPLGLALSPVRGVRSTKPAAPPVVTPTKARRV